MQCQIKKLSAYAGNKEGEEGQEEEEELKKRKDKVGKRVEAVERKWRKKRRSWRREGTRRSSEEKEVDVEGRLRWRKMEGR